MTKQTWTSATVLSVYTVNGSEQLLVEVNSTKEKKYVTPVEEGLIEKGDYVSLVQCASDEHLTIALSYKGQD